MSAVAQWLGSRTLCSYGKEILDLADFTAVTVTKLTGSWALTEDAHIGRIVEITSGSAQGYRAIITDNDTTSVTCADADFVAAGVVIGDDGGVWTFGEKPSVVNKWFGIIQPTEPTEKNNLVDIRGIGFNRNVALLMPTKKDVGATVEVFPQTAEMFEFILGKKSGSGTVADPYIYAETERLPTMTIVGVARGPADNKFVREFLGCKVNEATLSSREYEPLRLRMTMAIKDVQKGTTVPNITTDNSNPFMFAQTKLTINSVDYIMKSWNLTIRHGLIKDWHDSGDGSRVPQHITEGERYYELTGEITPSDSSLWELMNNATTELDASLTITRGPNDKITITLDDCALEDAPVPLPDEEVVRQTFTLRVRSCSVSEVVSA